MTKDGRCDHCHTRPAACALELRQAALVFGSIEHPHSARYGKSVHKLAFCQRRRSGKSIPSGFKP